MRPALLFALFSSITALKGVGPRYGALIERLAGTHIIDLLCHLPYAVLERRPIPSLAEATPSLLATLTVTISKHEAGKGRTPYRIITQDCAGMDLSLTFFNGNARYLEPQYPVGQSVVVLSGRLEKYRDEWQMSHPDYVAKEASTIPQFEPIYSLTQGLSSKLMRRAITAALNITSELPEWIDANLIARQQFPPWRTALQLVHQPENISVVQPDNPARMRLAYDELFANQAAMLILRPAHQKRAGQKLECKNQLVQKLLATLPFAPTNAQKRCFNEIKNDLSSNNAMLRLLQGDVGSGKTLVALMAMLHTLEAGAQAAMLAPTELLAKQHHAKLSEMLAPLEIEIALLTGKQDSKTRNETLQRLAAGTIKLIVGTHALIQDSVSFQNLGLAIIDEQHRFGVNQRAALAQKGKNAHILAMTATPIPRTLVMTIYGDMDVSLLDEKPAGRQPIDTRLLNIEKLDEMIAALKRHVESGQQAYWVCPLVEETENSTLANVTDRAAMLERELGEKIGLIHGQMKVDARDKIMEQFISGALKVLVATTVIEVGVDVPNASLMIIEHAERFGLAQLHQLRGRVGRGVKQSCCMLLYQAPLGAIAESRLKLMRKSENGFELAEEDLRLRGPGEMLGNRQSGLPEFKLAQFPAHSDLLKIAHDDAKLLMQKDPKLETERGKALRILLYLFSYDRALTLLRGG